MKTPIYHHLFGNNLGILPNPQLAVLDYGITTIEQARQKSGTTIIALPMPLLMAAAKTVFSPTRNDEEP